MSSAVVPGALPFPEESRVATFSTPAAKPAPPQPEKNAYVRRRGSLVQGQALETLGHAVEYLVDSALFHRETSESRANQDAVQILMRASRAVFAECPEVLPLRRRFSRWALQLASRTKKKTDPAAC